METPKLSPLDQEIRRRESRKSLLAFVKNEFPEYYVTKFHEDLINRLQYFFDHPTGKRWNIALISAPPRHGKSHIVTEKIPVWLLGNHPRDEVIITGYGTQIAEQFGRTARDNYDRVAHNVWPDAGLDKNVQSAGHWQTALGGKCHSAGLMAPLTSYGANYLFIDDPIKNMEQADSDKIGEKIQGGLIPDVFSRVYPNGFIVIMATRWVENDPTGWVRENMAEFVNLDINYTALCEDEATDPLGRKLDESLIGPHMGDNMAEVPTKIAITSEIMKQQRAASIGANGIRYWNALYQDHPSTVTGNLVDVNNFQLIPSSEIPWEKMEYNIVSADLTLVSKELSDFVAIGLWGYYNNDHYLLHLCHKRMTFSQTLAKLKEIPERYKDKCYVDEIIIENKANGPAAIDVLRMDEKLPPVVAIEASKATGSKVARAQAVAPYIEQGHVYINQDMPADDIEQLSKGDNFTPVELFLYEWKKFPYLKKDDIVDMTTQYLARAHKLMTGEEVKFERTIVRYTHWNAMMWSIYERMTEPERVQFLKDVGTPYEWKPDED